MKENMAVGSTLRILLYLFLAANTNVISGVCIRHQTGSNGIIQGEVQEDCSWMIRGPEKTSIYMSIETGDLLIIHDSKGASHSIGPGKATLSETNTVLIDREDMPRYAKIYWKAVIRCDIHDCNNTPECQVPLFYTFGGACLVLINVTVLAWVCINCNGYRERSKIISTLLRKVRGLSTTDDEERAYELNASTEEKQTYMPLGEKAEFTSIGSVYKFKKDELLRNDVVPISSTEQKVEVQTENINVESSHDVKTEDNEKAEGIQEPPVIQLEVPSVVIDDVNTNGNNDKKEETTVEEVLSDEHCSDYMVMRPSERKNPQLERNSSNTGKNILKTTFYEFKSFFDKHNIRLSPHPTRNQRIKSVESCVEEADDGYLKPLDIKHRSAINLRELKNRLSKDIQRKSRPDSDYLHPDSAVESTPLPRKGLPIQSIMKTPEGSPKVRISKTNRVSFSDPH